MHYEGHRFLRNLVNKKLHSAHCYQAMEVNNKERKQEKKKELLDIRISVIFIFLEHHVEKQYFKTNVRITA